MNTVLGIIGAILGLLAYIFKIKGDNKGLQNEISTIKQKEVIKETQQAIDQQSAASGSAVDEYEKLRADYLRQNNTGVRQGDSGEGQGN